MYRKVNAPTMVHMKNCKRSAATTPPVVMKSAAEGRIPPAPFGPLSELMPAASTPAPALIPSSSGKFFGTGGQSNAHCTRVRQSARYTYAKTKMPVHTSTWNLDKLYVPVSGSSKSTEMGVSSDPAVWVRAARFESKYVAKATTTTTEKAKRRMVLIDRGTVVIFTTFDQGPSPALT